MAGTKVFHPTPISFSPIPVLPNGETAPFGAFYNKWHNWEAENGLVFVILPVGHNGTRVYICLGHQDHCADSFENGLSSVIPLDKIEREYLLRNGTRCLTNEIMEQLRIRDIQIYDTLVVWSFSIEM